MNDYSKADNFLIKTLGLNKNMRCKEVKQKILKYLKDTYKGKVSTGRLEMFAHDFTESICLKLGIEQN